MKLEEMYNHKEGLRRYIMMAGRLHHQVMTSEDSNLLMGLWCNFGIYEAARVQMGAEPTFTDEEYDSIFEQGQQQGNPLF